VDVRAEIDPDKATKAPDLRGALKSLPTSEGGGLSHPEISSEIRREKTLSAPKLENQREIVGNPKRKN
jgi:hypothetical protein